MRKRIPLRAQLIHIISLMSRRSSKVLNVLHTNGEEKTALREFFPSFRLIAQKNLSRHQRSTCRAWLFAKSFINFLRVKKCLLSMLRAETERFILDEIFQFINKILIVSLPAMLQPGEALFGFGCTALA